jgi:hypothetical protein
MESPQTGAGSDLRRNGPCGIGQRAVPPPATIRMDAHERRGSNATVISAAAFKRRLIRSPAKVRTNYADVIIGGRYTATVRVQGGDGFHPGRAAERSRS